MASRFLDLRSKVLLRGLGSLAMLVVASGALGQDRCEGTLCDLYYDHVAPQQPKAPAATSPATTSPAQPASAPAQQSDSLLGRILSGGSSQPATGAPPQPATAAPPPAKRPFVAVQGGGVIGLLQGGAPQRCTGTLCDLYYGGPPPEEAAPSQPPAAAAEPATDEALADAPPMRGGRHTRTAAPREERPSCVGTARDPWQCYR